MSRAALIVASALLAGCTGQAGRGAWMRDVLVDADRAFLSRDPDRVAAKYARMAEDPYAFLRGTLPWSYAQLQRADPSRSPTGFLTVPEATAVLLVGDPHPENLSTQRALPAPGDPAPALTVEFVDLDAAAWGPWLVDVRRAATGIRALGAASGGCDGACQDAAAAALVEAYAEAVEGEPAPAWGEVIEELLEEAEEEGPEQKRTGNRTIWVDLETGREVPPGRGERRLRTGPPLDADGKGLLPLTRSEADLLDEVLVAMAPQLPPGFRALDAALRLGSGVSSLPAIRFAVLYDLGDPGPEDDGLMNLREILDPPPGLPGRATHSPGTFADNADRLDFASRRLWSAPDNDPVRAEGCAHGLCFKSLSWTSWFQDLERRKVADDVADDDLNDDDFIDLGRDLGGVLAREHLRGARSDGGSPASAIAQDLAAGGGAEALVAELTPASADDHAQLVADYALFVDLLDRHGPLLGAEHLVEHAP